ncbi:MAG: hypothetical protein ACI9YU_002241 [Flavobacteriales bacterium]|jgi:hypothetical protein
MNVRMMKGKNVFTKSEVEELRGLIKKRINADRTLQKSIRAKMRKLKFYGQDDFGIVDLQPRDFEMLITSGRIKVLGENQSPIKENPVLTPTAKSRPKEKLQSPVEVEPSNRLSSPGKQQLLTDFANQSDKLFDLGIIRTDSFTGEIGEYVASVMFDLDKTDRVTRAVDGVDSEGKKYQIKAKVVDSDKLSYGIGELEIDEIDFLVVVYFSPTYEAKKVISIDSSQLPNGKIGISNKFLESISYKMFDEEEIKLPLLEKQEIKKFGRLYCSLQTEGIIRSRRIVGDLGEFYASQELNLTLNDNKNEKGVDAYDENGLKYEVKTRRVYESGRRTGKSRRLNNLVGKDSKFLVVVVLDRSFRCAGMWLIPMLNVANPKSAHLQIVNTTQGVKNIVKSRIDWLN